jgi:hypothetical protein
MSEEAVLHRGSNPRGDANFIGCANTLANAEVSGAKRHQPRFCEGDINFANSLNYGCRIEFRNRGQSKGAARTS